MNKIWILTKKEIKVFFDSLLAYILLFIFLGLTGFFTWLFLFDIFSNGQANLKPFFRVAFFTFSVFIPAITMSSFAEEKNQGTIELLLTKSISDWQVVMGKALAVFILVLIAIGLTLPYYISITYLGDNIDHGMIICGYLGLILVSLSATAIGIWASSIAQNQITALLISLGIIVVLIGLFWIMSFFTSGMVSNVVDSLSMFAHFESMMRGVIDIKDVVYFLSIFAAGMLLTEAQLSKRHQV